MAEPLPEPGRRRTFAPVVLLGLAGAGLAAVAGHRAWATVSGGDGEAGSLARVALGDGVGESPAAGALALVCLACWGVLLVTRGRVRRVVAVLGALAALGLVVATVLGLGAAPDAVREAVTGLGVEGADVGLTGWFVVAVPAALVALVAAVLAVRLVPGWPEMGSRYDAPGAGAVPAAAPQEEQSNLELWKAMDEGHDPTA